MSGQDNKNLPFTPQDLERSIQIEVDEALNNVWDVLRENKKKLENGNSVQIKATSFALATKLRDEIMAVGWSVTDPYHITSQRDNLDHYTMQVSSPSHQVPESPHSLYWRD